MSRWPMPFKKPCYHEVWSEHDPAITPCMYSDECPDDDPCLLSDAWEGCEFGSRMLDRRKEGGDE